MRSETGNLSSWSFEFTYIKQGSGHIYVAATMDWYSCKIVSRNLSDTLGVQPVLALSDQKQRLSDDFRKLLSDLIPPPQGLRS